MKKNECYCGAIVNGKPQSYAQCCEPLHLEKAVALTAEQLMRSRYSAYVINNMKYVQQTWYPDSCPDDILDATNNLKWLELIIIRAWSSEIKNEAFVEFKAKYRTYTGRAETMHEISRFVFLPNSLFNSLLTKNNNKENGNWFYIDGDIK